MYQRGLKEFIKAKTTWLLGVPQPHEAEARGLKEAIKWLASMGLSRVSIELDCKQVVEGIDRRLNTNSMFGVILDICKASLRIYQNFKISLIRGQTNNSVACNIPDFFQDCRLTPQTNTSLFSVCCPHSHAYRKTSQ